MELAVALDLAFETIKQIALKFRDATAAQAGHVDMIALGTAFVVVLLALHVHKIEFVDQAVAFEQADSAVHGHTVDLGIEFAGFAQDLAGVEVLLGRFHDREDGAALASHAQAAGHEFGLEASRLLSLW